MDDLNGPKILATDHDDDFKSDWITATLSPVGERQSRAAEANVSRKPFRGPLDANAACRMRRRCAMAPGHAFRL